VSVLEGGGVSGGPCLITLQGRPLRREEASRRGSPSGYSGGVLCDIAGYG
jgi:hypothetical protein